MSSPWHAWPNLVGQGVGPRRWDSKPALGVLDRNLAPSVGVLPLRRVCDTLRLFAGNRRELVVLGSKDSGESRDGGGVLEKDMDRLGRSWALRDSFSSWSCALSISSCRSVLWDSMSFSCKGKASRDENKAGPE